MNRRQFLSAGAAAGMTAVSGCLFGIHDWWGGNPHLDITNGADSEVRLEITVERETHYQGGSTIIRTVVFDENVTVPAGQEKSLKVFGDHSYTITVRLEDQRIQFGASPTCNDAFTRITVTEDSDLTASALPCEGIVHEWPSPTPESSE